MIYIRIVDGMVVREVLKELYSDDITGRRRGPFEFTARLINIMRITPTMLHFEMVNIEKKTRFLVVLDDVKFADVPISATEERRHIYVQTNRNLAQEGFKKGDLLVFDARIEKYSHMNGHGDYTLTNLRNVYPYVGQ